jgi:23S rRNA (adenine2030-N6)-methyltransferase
MLSYRHGYHAGNFADVMKHVVLTAILRYMTRKEAPLCYIDTHAGAGTYDLKSAHATKNRESDSGIGRLWHSTDAPEPVSAYLELMHRYDKGEEPRHYPGSPWIAAELLRPQDRLMLCELHGSDFLLLQQAFRKDRRVHCYAEDGYRFGKSLLPPAERRGLVLMDPSYELANEYDTAMTSLISLQRRFTAGTYALWYPVLDERRTGYFRQALERSSMRDVLNLELKVASRRSLPGMYGCGIVVVNPPWTLSEDMQRTLPWLAEMLGRDDAASASVEQWVEE